MRRRAAPAVLVLLAWALRTHLLGEASPWWDEALAVWAVRKPLLDATLWTAGDVHPPLFFWLLWPWSRLVGEEEFVLRVLPAALGTLSVALAGAMAARLGGRRAGLPAMLLVAIARFEVWWSMELRMYVLAGTLVLAASYAAARWLGGAAGPAAPDRRPGGSAGPAAPEQRPDVTAGPADPSRRRWLAAYVLACAALLHTVYLGVVAVAALALGGALILAAGARGVARPERRRRLAAWLGAQAAAALLLLPWLAVAVPRMQSWTSQRGPAASVAFVSRLWSTLLATGVSTDIDRYRAAAAVFVAAGLLVPLALAWRSGASRARLLRAVAIAGPFAVLPPIAVWAATQPRSLFYSPSVEARYLVPFAGPVYVLVAVVLASVIRRRPAAGAVLAGTALIVLWSTLSAHYGARRDDGRLASMALDIWSHAEPGDVVVLVSGNRYPLFLYHYERRWDVERAGPPYAWPPGSRPDTAARPPVVLLPGPGGGPIAPDEADRRLREVTARYRRVWLAEVDPQLQDPDRHVRNWFWDQRGDGGWRDYGHVPYGPDWLHLFARSGAAETRVTGLSSRWPGVRALPGTGEPWATSLRLAPLVGLTVRRVLPGDEIHVHLWRTAPPAPASPLMDPWVVLAPTVGPAPHVRAGHLAYLGNASIRQILPIDDRVPGGEMAVAVRTSADAVSVLGRVDVLAAPPPVAADLTVVEEALGHAWRGAWRDVGADIGHATLLRAATAPAVVRPGGTLVVDLVWRHRSPSPRLGGGDADGGDLAIFAHLFGPIGPAATTPLRGAPAEPPASPAVRAVQDGAPSSSGWPYLWYDSVDPRSAEPVFDRHVLVIDPAAPPGRYEVEVGIYDRGTGIRFEPSPSAGVARSSDVTIDAAARRVILGTVMVR